VGSCCPLLDIVHFKQSLDIQHTSLTIVCAITSKYDEPLYPTEVLIPAPEGGMKINSAILANQIRSVDKQRLVRRLGSLKSATMQKVDRALKLHLLLVSSIPLSRFGISSSQQTIVDFGRIRPGGFQKR
jgi:mRNA-degrading endonuclease toxin of MazEF toxin-antitoxin module